MSPFAPRRHFSRLLFALFLTLAGGGAQSAAVTLENRDGHARLLRDGQPFQVRGAAAFGELDLFQRIGGNTLRVFGPEHDFLLPEARRRGLAVIYGFDLGKPEKGFDYRNPDALAAQQQAVLARAKVLKDQAEILVWALGNELELKVEDPAPVFDAVNRLARALKALDPKHPTMVVVAEVWPEKVAALLAHCPDVDILGINSYGGAVDAAARARGMGWTKPILITEFGAPGHWEMPATAWGAALEPSSSAKAEVYARTWREGIAGQPEVLGGVAFLWGAKQEVTPTWYGMLLDDGSRLGAVDALALAWRGSLPFAPAPELKGVQLVGLPPHLRPGQQAEAEALPGTPAPLRYRWALREESHAEHSNREGQAAPVLVEGALQGEGPRIRITAPAKLGAYRLYVVGYGPDGGAATANLPLWIEP